MNIPKIAESRTSFKGINLVAVARSRETDFIKALRDGLEASRVFEEKLVESGIKDTFSHALFRKEPGQTEFFVLSEEDAAPIKELNKPVELLERLFRDDMPSDLFRAQLDLLIDKINKTKEELATFIINNKKAKL